MPPLKRTRSVTTTTMPSSMVVSMAKKKRRIMPSSRMPRLQLLSAPGTPFPTRCRAVLRYTSYFNLSVSVSGAAQYFLRCNSVYDPDFTGVGSQPRGYDQYAALYNQYTVNKAKLKATLCIPSTGATGQLIFGATFKPDTSGLATLDQCADQPYTVSRICNQQGPTSDRTVYSTWDRKKRFPNDQTSASLSSQVTTNPAEQEYWQIWYHNAYNPLVAGASDVTVQFTIDYDVEFYELKAIPAS